MTEDKRNSKFSTKDMYLKGTIIALIVTIPSLTTFGISWKLLDDLIQAAIIGGIVHFISMIFSFKLSKKIFAKNTS